LGKQKSAFQLGQIDAINSNGILIHGDPEPTEAEKVRRLQSLIDDEIWSNEGNRIGKIIDCLFDARSGKITHYLFASAGWAGMLTEVYQLPPAQILSFGQRVVVAESELSSFEIYQASIPRKLTQLGETFKEDVVEEWSAATRQVEAKTEQAKEQFQQLTEQARERALRLSEQFKQKAEVFTEQFQETTQTLLEQAREKGQTLAEQLKEGSHTLSRQVEEGIENLTIPEVPEADLEDWDDDWFDDLDDAPETQPKQPEPPEQPSSATPTATPAATPSTSAITASTAKVTEANSISLDEEPDPWDEPWD
jgi:sporulation protein YlmC with PRC-barrel domain